MLGTFETHGDRMNSDHKINPLIVDAKFVQYLNESIAEYRRKERGWNFSLEEIADFIFRRKKAPPRPPTIFDTNRYLHDLIAQLSARNEDAIYALWANYGIDKATARHYMDFFALKDDNGTAYNLMIPADSALIFVWYRYRLCNIDCWEELCCDFGIYTYVFIYGFLFPQKMLEIPSWGDVLEKEADYMEKNAAAVESGITMGHIIEMILLYKDDKKHLLEPDVPFFSGDIVCNPEWSKKLKPFCPDEGGSCKTPNSDIEKQKTQY